MAYLNTPNTTLPDDSKFLEEFVNILSILEMQSLWLPTHDDRVSDRTCVRCLFGFLVCSCFTLLDHLTWKRRGTFLALSSFYLAISQSTLASLSTTTGVLTQHKHGVEHCILSHSLNYNVNKNTNELIQFAFPSLLVENRSNLPFDNYELSSLAPSMILRYISTS